MKPGAAVVASLAGRLGRPAAFVVLLVAPLGVACDEPVSDTGDCTVMIEDFELPCTPCEHDPPLTWNNFGKGFLAQNCNGCHSTIVPPEHRFEAPAGVNFDIYPTVMTYAERIVVRAAGSGDMPPGGGPRASELLRLQEWIQCEVIPDRDAQGGSP